MKIEISGAGNLPQTITLAGERFVIMPESEYHRLRATAEGNEPVLPARDKQGNYPAAEALGASIARSIVRSRRERGMTQVELARRAGIRPETLNRIEQGKHAPSVATLERLEQAFAIDKRSSRHKP
ncbi:MAG TPA: helix-turn-helix transcriptional regulator [Pirellulales bacterium]|nr:helix-turn-helix transcriptional regulator [Pirellulales bacterium]